MARKVLSGTFIQQIREQLHALREAEQGYAALQVYVTGIAEPWEFIGQDEFEFHEGTGVLIVRDGPSDENGRDNAEVPEYVFRLDAIVATQLVQRRFAEAFFPGRFCEASLNGPGGS